MSDLFPALLITVLGKSQFPVPEPNNDPLSGGCFFRAGTEMTLLNMVLYLGSGSFIYCAQRLQKFLKGLTDT